MLAVPPLSEDVEEAREVLEALARLRRGELPEQQEVLPPAEAAVEKREERGTKGWTQLQQRLERTHGWQVRRDLGLETVLEPVFPEKNVQRRFLDACKELDHSMLLTYHGTRSANFQSIEQKGLLVPGHGGVKVAHGSAHGVGIYTAQLGKASLSQGFSDSSSLFLCAVCDTSEPPEQSQEELNAFVPSGSHVQTRFPRSYMFQGKRFGNHQLKQESEEVRHVGDAVVIFKEKCVAPIFIATVLPSQPKREADDLEKALQPREECWELGPQQAGRRRVVVPEGRDNLIRFGSGRSGRSGRTVWLPPMPKERPSHHELHVARRRNQRDWQRARLRCRAAKKEDCFGRA